MLLQAESCALPELQLKACAATSWISSPAKLQCNSRRFDPNLIAGRELQWSYVPGSLTLPGLPWSFVGAEKDYPLHCSTWGYRSVRQSVVGTVEGAPGTPCFNFHPCYKPRRCFMPGGVRRRVGTGAAM